MRRELSELSERLTNDGRDALAALQAKLELDAEQRVAEERRELKEKLACECLLFQYFVCCWQGGGGGKLVL